MKINRRSILGASLLSPLASLPTLSAAETPAQSIPILDFFRTSVLEDAVLSPDGKAIAALRQVNGRWNVAVLDIATHKTTIITNFSDGDAEDLIWVNNDRLLFSVSDSTRGRSDQIAGGMFGINKDASHYTTLAERSMQTEMGAQKLLPAGISYLSHVLDKGELTSEVYVEVGSYQGLGRTSSNLYRLDTLTGHNTLLTLGGPNNVQGWILDIDGVPRVAVSSKDEDTEVWVRDSASTPWRSMFKYDASHFESTVTPLEFDAAGKLYVAAYNGRDNMAIWGCDPKTGKLDQEPVVAIDGYDLEGGLAWDKGRKTLLGVRYEAAQRGTYWIDEKRAAVQAALDKQLPGMVNLFALSEGTALVHSISDRDPGRYFVFDEKSGSLQGIGQSRPWIKPEQMSPTRFVNYTARDGMKIPAQLTLPKNSNGKPPLVVLHYGGPWVRPIHWGWDAHVQFLASRGYAVFMPAPRASTGFGAKLYRAGWKQWGLAMQDDVTDGVRYLVDKGLVDGKRVCLAGASYGGYLTMMGLAKEPEMFRCGINWVGVTDPNLMFDVTWTDFNRFGGSDAGRKMLIGDPVKDAEQFKRTSPIARAAEIKQPVLMAYGGLDVRVPRINGDKMRDALNANHNEHVEYVVYAEEGHGWALLKNNLDFWNRVEKFLATNL